MLNKIKIAVILGGRSNEKETSLDSGRNVANKLSKEKYEVIPVFLNKDLKLYKINHKLLTQNSTKEIESNLQKALELNEATYIKWDDLSSVADFVFIALHGGEGENGTLQGALEMLKIPYNGSGIFTSGLCMTKYQTSMYLKDAGFDILDCMLIEKRDWNINKESIIKKISTEINFPIITKPNDDGCSVMVYKAKDAQELTNNIEKILQNKECVLIEAFASNMMELTVGCIGNSKATALTPTQAVSAGDILTIEEKFLPGAGLNVTPAPLSNEDLQIVKGTIERAYEALRCKGYARLDCFYDQQTKKLYIIDVNTLPGLTPATCIFHQAAEEGMSPSDLLDTIITLGFENHNKLNIIKQLTQNNNASISLCQN